MTEVFKPLGDLKEVLGSYHARKIRKELEEKKLFDKDYKEFEI